MSGPKRKATCKHGHDLTVQRRERVNGSTYCQACLIEKAQKRYQASSEHRSRLSEYRKKRYRKWKYGISNDEFHRMLIEQHGGCAICKTPLWAGIKTCVDHCHHTGKIRGLLCGNCNSALGLFKDNIPFLMAAEDYLWDRWEG